MIRKMALIRMTELLVSHSKHPAHMLYKSRDVSRMSERHMQKSRVKYHLLQHSSIMRNDAMLLVDSE